LSSDDYSILFLDQNPFDPEAPATAPITFADGDFIARRSYWCEWRHFHAEVPPATSNSSPWITLNENEFYQIQGYVVEGGGLDHITAAVEVEREDAAGHYHAQREIQLLEARHNGVLEEWEIMINQTAPVPTQEEDPTYRVTLVDPRIGDKNIGSWVSDAI
jgi:hypothetical protein